MSTKVPSAPEDLRESGRKLWQEILASWSLDVHEVAILKQACRTVDLLDQLQASLEADGVMSESSQGSRVHPAVAEIRQQSVTLARLFAALRMPVGERSEHEEDERPPGRSVRGVYGIREIAS